MTSPNISVLNDMVFKTQPYEHQAVGLIKSRDKTAYALLCEMGTGKTKILIDTVSYLFSRGEVNGLVVVAPKSICRNWAEKEIGNHLPDHIDRRIVLWGPDTKKLQEQLKTLATVEPLKLHILVINIEAISGDRGYEAVYKFLSGHRAMMVVDESTIIKNHKAERTKTVNKLGKLARYRRILTGTPVTQSPLDVFSQFEFLEPGCLGSQSFYGFRNQYAVLRKRYVNGRSFDEIVGYQRLGELQRDIDRLSFRVLKKDCLDLPKKIYQERHIELAPEQKRYYQELREESITFLKSGDAIATPLVITRDLRLRQALCNIAPTEDGGTAQIAKEDPRADEVLRILEEAGDQKVIIWSNFVPAVKKLRDLIIKEYGAESVGCIYGDVEGAERQQIVNAFEDKSNPLRYLVINPKTGGRGLTLVAASLVIYHDNDWSLDIRQQSEDRAHRIGQTEKVTYIDLIAPGTMDEKILASLTQKGELADQVTGDAPRKMTAAKLLELLQ